jgi:hypothetical protein
MRQKCCIAHVCCASHLWLLPYYCRVRGILDTALAAADSGGAPDATPASVLQQLAQARQLYETDKAASWGIVERVLADVEDAQVGLAVLLAA